MQGSLSTSAQCTRWWTCVCDGGEPYLTQHRSRTTIAARRCAGKILFRCPICRNTVPPPPVAVKTAQQPFSYPIPRLPSVHATSFRSQWFTSESQTRTNRTNFVPPICPRKDLARTLGGRDHTPSAQSVQTLTTCRMMFCVNVSGSDSGSQCPPAISRTSSPRTTSAVLRITSTLKNGSSRP